METKTKNETNQRVGRIAKKRETKIPKKKQTNKNKQTKRRTVAIKKISDVRFGKKEMRNGRRRTTGTDGRRRPT